MVGEWCEYPMFQRMRLKVRDEADLLAISPANPRDLTYGSDEDMEKPYFQYVSGWMFDSFGIRPALGRLFTEADDLKTGTHPYAVLSYDYWTRRFGRDPKVIGCSFHLVKTGEESRRSGNDLYTVIGVAGKGFTGVETGTFTDIFVPTVVNSGRLPGGAGRGYCEPGRHCYHATPDLHGEVTGIPEREGSHFGRRGAGK